MTPVSVTNKIICIGAIINYVSNFFFGGGGSKNGYFCLFLLLFLLIMGEGVKKGQKFAFVVYECCLSSRKNFVDSSILCEVCKF